MNPVVGFYVCVVWLLSCWALRLGFRSAFYDWILWLSFIVGFYVGFCSWVLWLGSLCVCISWLVLYLGSMAWFHVRLLLSFMIVFCSWACGFVLRMVFVVEFVSWFCSCVLCETLAGAYGSVGSVAEFCVRLYAWGLCLGLCLDSVTLVVPPCDQMTD